MRANSSTNTPIITTAKVFAFRWKYGKNKSHVLSLSMSVGRRDTRHSASADMAAPLLRGAPWDRAQQAEGLPTYSSVCLPRWVPPCPGEPFVPHVCVLPYVSALAAPLCAVGVLIPPMDPEGEAGRG